MNQKETTSQQPIGQLKKTAESRLFDKITDLLLPHGYELINMEAHLQKTKILRLFIDFAVSTELSAASSGNISEETTPSHTRKIGIEDCVKVSRLLEEPLEVIEEIAIIFPTEYELEVSSPGLDRPLRKMADFERFKGKKVKIHTYRSLNADDLKNAEYFEKNPKQKNYIGIILGTQKEKEPTWSVKLDCNPVLLNPISIGKKGQKIKKPNKKDALVSSHFFQIFIPSELISQARIEPDLDFDGPEGHGDPEIILTGDI